MSAPDFHDLWTQFCAEQDEQAELIGRFLDWPGVYMGGASKHNKDRGYQLLEMLRANGWQVVKIAEDAK